MKTKCLTLFAVTFLVSTLSFAKIWRVNNNVGVAADFTTAQAANDNASVQPGDTIHLEPSTTTYGALTCTKRLTWISTGAFLGIHPNEQFSGNAARVVSLTAYVAGCANSVFHINVDNNVDINANGLRFERCFVGGGIYIQNYGYGIPTNVVVFNSYSVGGMTINYGNNHVITNNIFGASLQVGSSTTLAVITHNVFNTVSNAGGTVNNSIVENNIFNKTATPYVFNNSTVQYNMAGSPNILPAGNNNQNGVAMSNVFVNNNGTDDASFVLKAGSPAIGAGSGTPAVDLGAFGGASPFRQAMQPAIPAIYKIQAPAAPAGNTLNVTFSTKSNN